MTTNIDNGKVYNTIGILDTIVKTLGLYLPWVPAGPWTFSLKLANGTARADHTSFRIDHGGFDYVPRWATPTPTHPIGPNRVQWTLQGWQSHARFREKLLQERSRSVPILLLFGYKVIRTE